MKNFVLALCLALPSLALADSLKVSTSKVDLSVTKIIASNVSAVSIRLYQEVVRTDCNKITLDFDIVHVSGNKDVAWYQTAFANTSMSTTQVYCPREKTTETIYSQPVVVNSLVNVNANGEIDFDLIHPSYLKVEVTEIK